MRPFGTMMEEDLWRSAILGRSARVLREPGLGTGSESEPLEAAEELEAVGERLGLEAVSRYEASG